MSHSAPKKQASISSFFSQSGSSPNAHGAQKRHSSPIDLTGDSDGEGAGASYPRKRVRTTSTFFSRTPEKPRVKLEDEDAVHRTQTVHEGLAEQWRFDPASPPRQPSSSTVDQSERREIAKRILLGKNGTSSRNRSNDTDISLEGQEDPEDDGDDVGEFTGSGPDLSSGDESDQAFSKLMNTFANPNGKTKKGKRRLFTESKKKKTEEVGPSGEPYTPLELQVMELKKKHPDTILMVEVGYKIIFYGDDAKIASRELGIMCFPKRNFLNASIPLHRRDVHLKKLLSRGYKVGLVEQTETAALKKASENKNELFTRKVTRMCTSATYVDEMNSVDDIDSTSAPTLMCLVEELKGGMGADERVTVGMIVIAPSTGDVVWDEFEDNHMRTELETRMVHTQPYEILLPSGKLSKPSEKMILHFTEHSNADYSRSDHKIRIERFKQEHSYTEAFSFLTKFYSDETKENIASESYNSGKLMAAVTDFSQLVVRALAHSVRYLSDFHVEDSLRETKFFAKFTERTHMLLNGNTLTNLEIYRNETDYTTKGSLMWILDHTSTKFGARMLRSWVGRPLVDLTALKARIDAVEEILADDTTTLTFLRELLRRLPDLAKGLCRIQYGKCTPQELAILLTAFNKIAFTFQPIDSPSNGPFKSYILNEIVFVLPKLREPMKELMGAVSINMAKEGKKEALWTDPDKYPDLDSYTASIQVVESELMDELKNIRKILQKPALQYMSWAGEEYVIEVQKTHPNVPVNWHPLTSSKFTKKYHTPEVKRLLGQRAQWKEALDAEANKAYLSFLQEITQKYYAVLRDAVNKLAVADCLLSLARVALQEGYVKPEFTNDDTVEIIQGRHPLVEALRSDPFVPNSIHLGHGQPRSKIITGPNMGGKSSVVRMTALCAIMAQVGSYVPAESMRIGLLDGVLTRMGASDELARGRSTFMVEMQETSDILQMATPRTLVILDELGRGTSTFDGMAIASATLQHLVQTTKCMTLFITHYPQVASELERKFPADIENLHMGFTEDTRIDGTREVTFLYKLASGITAESFGVECARLAGLSESILEVASSQSRTMRGIIEGRIRRNKLRRCAQIIRRCVDNSPHVSTSIEELRHAFEEMEHT